MGVASESSKMPSVRYFALPALVGVFLAAHFGLAWQMEKNGTFTQDSVFGYKNRILPYTDIPIKLPETGIEKVDNYFAFMMAFFYMALDPRNVRPHLIANQLLGTLSGAFFLMCSEAHTSTSSFTFFFLTYFFELGGEIFGIGLFTPLWTILHLATTKIPTATSQSNAEEILSAPRGTIFALGWALVFGHLAPTLLMIFGDVKDESILSGQLWTILRLFHPVFTFGFFLVFKALFPAPKASADPPSQRLVNKHKIYRFATVASAIGHVSMLYVLFARFFIPEWIKDDVLAQIDPYTVLLPTPYWLENPVKIVPFVVGVGSFLYWDNFCASTSSFIWSFTLFIEAVAPHFAKIGVRGVLNTVGQALFTTLLAGPVAGAAFFLQERDTVVVSYAAGSKAVKA